MMVYEYIIWLILGFTAVYINATAVKISDSNKFLESSKNLKSFGRDVNYTVENLIESYGYEVETHNVTTTDGYILSVHRIPHGTTDKNNGRVAFLMHGFICSSADWVIAGPGNSLAFALADEGYDVWLGNARGNSESRKHISLDPDNDEAFWKFSWNEIGLIDVPQMIDYILNVTESEQIYYVGHSQGTTTYYVMTSELPEYNSKIKVQVSLAPVGYIDHMTSPLLQILSTWTGPLEKLFDLIGYNEFLPTDDFFQYVLGEAICQDDTLSQTLCTNVLFALFGFSREQMNETLLPLLLKYSPAGSSTNQLVHWGQEIQSGCFRKYDYGFLGNLLNYGWIIPPAYDLTKITTPTYFFYSLNDWLCAVEDVNRTCTEMKNACLDQILVSEKNWNHLDYIYGNDKYELVYTKVLSLFAKYN